MSGKMPRFLMTSIVSMLLVACGVDTLEAIPSQTKEEIESIASDNEEVTTIESPAVEEEKTESKASQVSQANEPEVAEATQLAIALNQLQEKNQEQALNRLFLETHLEKEEYSYYFVETDSLDYVEIEVREIRETETEHASLEGVYRYIVETDEILMRDYLTGDFMPYEKID